MKKTVVTGVSLDETVFDRVEKRRGLVSRSKFINDILDKNVPADAGVNNN